ncbi:MAG: UDP-3-O-[3-hydroxymyristoyl] N-acetylglucosamine deacetylase [Phycisphaerales bacterium]|nr:MAG: UDP-3-O-[3-hydroxymyristoyl] N-acetylglucosamine deacetylase [Phycisphaerales bacterium]
MLQTTEQSSARPATRPAMQHTLAEPVVIAGKGLLLGEEARVTIHPAPINHGIVFERTDLNPAVKLPAVVTNVVRRARRTTLKVGDASVETIEHCMSAFAGLRIDNALVQIEGPELPCGDGSAAPFVEPILKAGIAEQDAPRRIFRIQEPLVVEEGDAMLAAFPSDTDEFRVLFDLDYGPNSHRIQRQSQTFASSNGNYQHDIARARTYSLREEAQALWDRGMCTHLTPRDVLVIGDDGPIENAYRFENEPVRHKIVDLLGDLYLVGCPVHGRFVAYKSGHELNQRMCRRIREQMFARHLKEVTVRGREMDVRTIQRIMPHRYPMLLVDRVVEIQGDRKAIGVKNVTINEPFFQGHYPGTPIMPGVLVVEAMAQLGGLLMSQKLEHTGKIAVLLSLDRVKLRQPVTPGDQLVLEAESIRAKARTGTMKCRAYVGAKLAAEAQIRFMMVDAEQE